jgi:hypothetical protein
MTPADAFVALLSEGHRTLDLVMSDVTPEMLTWTPPGTANPIGITFAHAVGLEDLYLQQLLQQRPLLWEEQQWAGRLGHMLPPNQWNVQHVTPPNMDSLHEYKAAVFANSLAYVGDLSSDDLDRQLAFPGRDWSMSIAQMLAVVVAHTLGHAGEIAALKGVQGSRGLPF